MAFSSFNMIASTNARKLVKQITAGSGPYTVTATGSFTTSTSGSYTVYKFLSGAATISFSAPTVALVLLAGGGGGGGYASNTATSAKPGVGGGGSGNLGQGRLTFNATTTYSISIGSGGNGGTTSSVAATPGSSTIIVGTNVSETAGGGLIGISGASGGAGGNSGTGATTSTGTNVKMTYFYAQGGGAASTSGPGGAGGGVGGAGTNGTNVTSATSLGGIGYIWTQAGTSINLAGGGNGGLHSNNSAGTDATNSYGGGTKTSINGNVNTGGGGCGAQGRSSVGVNGGGAGGSGVVYIAVSNIAPTAPTAPSASANYGTSAKVRFTAPSGHNVVTYTVTSSPGSFTGTGKESPVIVYGLSTGVAYTFTVTATNYIGTSPASVATSPLTLTGPIWSILDGPVIDNTAYDFNTANPFGSKQTMSSNGQYMYRAVGQGIPGSIQAGAGGNFWYSTNYGDTWNANLNINDVTYGAVSNGTWGDGFLASVACSGSGQYVYIGVNTNPSYVMWSSNYGITFSTPVIMAGRVLINGIACNSTGSIIYVALYNQVNSLYKSTNAGTAGMTLLATGTNTTSQKISNVVCSTNGSIVHFSVNGTSNGIWRSIDGAVNFTNIYSAAPTGNMCCSDDGSIVYFYNQATLSNFFKSVNGAAPTTLTSLLPSNNIACDSTGNTVYFTNPSQQQAGCTVYVTTNAGASYTVSMPTIYSNSYTVYNAMVCNSSGIVLAGFANTAVTIGFLGRFK